MNIIKLEKIWKEKSGSNSMHNCTQNKETCSYSYSEWSDGRVSMSEFLRVSKEEDSFEICVSQKGLRIKNNNKND